MRDIPRTLIIGGCDISKDRNALEKGWVIANHILVSFHVAFISSVLSLPSTVSSSGEVIKFMFLSMETIISIIFMYLTFHFGIAIHEMGHYLKAVKLNALNESLLPSAQVKMNQNAIKRAGWYLEMFFKIPFGKFEGVTKTGLDYHPDAPYNLAVAANGPRASRDLALIALPIAIFFLTFGLVFSWIIVIYIGRLLLGIGAVGTLDFLLADPGKYHEFQEREASATTAAKKVLLSASSNPKWVGRVKDVADKMVYSNMQKLTIGNGKELTAPWELRNCGMGGRHTEKEFPESNISLQESMFVPLSPKDYEDAQEMTIALQTRLKEIIENAEGCTVKGIGTEGGIASYIKKEEGDILPEERLWRMQKQAILDCGYVPGVDVAMAIDPAASELENAYREEKGLSANEAVGNYLAWRDKDKLVLSRDDLLDIYCKAIDNDIPFISIEDGFAEDDDTGWKMLMDKLGDKLHIIGDDFITTKDSTIEEKADKGLINTALIKFNQIGTCTEGLLAILTAKGKGAQTVISHRSKSPIDDFEAHVALAANSLGLKVGGGSNSERLYKYESVVKIMRDALKKIQKPNPIQPANDKVLEDLTDKFINDLSITEIIAREAATNAGIPTVAVEMKVGLPWNTRFRELFSFEGSTPLGTSYGTDEAMHLVDSVIPAGSSVALKYPELFEQKEFDKTFRFKKYLTDEAIISKQDPDLTKLWGRAKRYNGKGCLNAVDNVMNFISKEFVGKRIVDIGSIVDFDRKLLELELGLAIKRGMIPVNATKEEQINIMQRKCNLGMNATLSMSLAYARLIGAINSKKLWEVLREVMDDTICNVTETNVTPALFDHLKQKIINHRINKLRYEDAVTQQKIKETQDTTRGKEYIKNQRASIEEEVIKKIEFIKTIAHDDQKDFKKILKWELSSEDLELVLQSINEKRPKGIKFYETLRKHVPVYDVKISEPS